jgi:hypothetical protein
VLFVRNGIIDSGSDGEEEGGTNGYTDGEC